jgi:vancomycin resistance protein VanJ
VAAVAWIVIVLALTLIHVLAPQRSGFLALTQVLEPYIVLTAVVVAPAALIGRDWIGFVVVGMLAVAVVARYGPGLITGPDSSATPRITVTAWNIEAGDNGAQRVRAGLAGVSSDFVALEELQPDMAAAIERDTNLVAQYPYRALYPDSSVRGVGLLSRYPIGQQLASKEPPYLRALVTDQSGDQLVVYVVHPLPGQFETILHVPVGIDTAQRDADIATIRSAVAADMAEGTRVVLLGDINATDREPAYADLSAGLIDARRAAGRWPGLTWRPDALTALPFGMLRIDYVFSTATHAPVDYSVRCTSLSDHCIVSASLR